MLRAQFAAYLVQIGAICRRQMLGAHLKKFWFTQVVRRGPADKRFSPREVLAGEIRAAGGPGGGIAVIDVEHRGADCNIAEPFQSQENVGFGCRSWATKTDRRRFDLRGRMLAVVNGIEYNPVD